MIGSCKDRLVLEQLMACSNPIDVPEQLLILKALGKHVALKEVTFHSSEDFTASPSCQRSLQQSMPMYKIFR